MTVTAGERQDVAVEPGEDLLEGLRFVGRRAVQALAHLGRRGAADRRVGALQPLDEQVDRAVAQLPHGGGIEREWIAVVRPPWHWHGIGIVAVGSAEWKRVSPATGRRSGAAPGATRVEPTCH